MLSHFSCVQLFVTPWAVAHQAPLSMEFSRQEYWSELPFPSPGDPPNPGIKPSSLVARALQADSLLLSHQWSLSLAYKFSTLVRYWPNIWKKKAIEAGQGRGTSWAATKWSSGAWSRAEIHSQGSVIGGGSPWGRRTRVKAVLLLRHPWGAASGQLSASSWGNRTSGGVTWVASLSRILSFSGPLFPKNI